MYIGLNYLQFSNKILKSENYQKPRKTAARQLNSPPLLLEFVNDGGLWFAKGEKDVVNGCVAQWWICMKLFYL